MSKTVIFNIGNADDIATHISNNLPITYSKEIQIETFKNGEISVTYSQSVRNNIVILASRLTNYSDLFRLFIASDAARRADCSKVYVIVPYLPHCRQERKDQKRTSITSKLIADLMETSGIDKVITVDLHTTAIEGNYSNRTTVENMLPIDNYCSIINNLKIENPKLVSPDMGFTKKIRLFDTNLNYGMVICDKQRDKPNQVSSIELIGDVKGFNCIIIDDMIDTGGTLIKVSEKLIESGAKSVIVFCTHGIFSDNALNRLEDSPIKEIYASNTFPIQSSGKLKVININDVYIDLLKRVFA